jgi:ppGpp synthetase/RelA/SpoT-type nucleotidyltranferase
MIKDENLPIVKSELNDSNELLEQLLANKIAELIILIPSDIYDIQIPIYGRVKTWESVKRKMEETENYEFKTLKKVRDLIGIRIVTLFLKNINEIAQLIDSKYQIIKDYNISENLDQDKFNYNSRHLILKADHFYIEIQLRTLNQHCWGEVSRKFNYKNEVDIPSKIKRPLFRASAQLESADIDINKFLKDRESFLQNLSTKTLEDIKDKELNFEYLNKTLNALLPVEYKGASDELLYPSLLSELKHRNINTVGDLENLINSQMDSAIQASKSRALNVLKRIEKGEETDFREDKVRKGIAFSFVGLIRTMYGNASR